jgi:hypothetical protein
MGKLLAQTFDRPEWPELEPETFAKKVNGLLESFWQVGTLERMLDFVAHLAKELQIPNDIKRLNRGIQRKVYLEPDSGLIKYSQEQNQVDALIYEYWKKRSIRYEQHHS